MPEQLVKARLTNASTGVFVPFLFNPTTIQRSRKVNVPADAVPGASDPLVRWNSGGEDSISLTIELCGESSLRLRGANLVNSRESDVEQDPTETLGVDAEIEWLLSFTYPVDPALGRRQAGPDLAIFEYGRAFRYFEGYVIDPEVNHKYFTPDGRTMRASVSLTIRRVVNRTVYADEVYSAGYEGFVL